MATFQGTVAVSEDDASETQGDTSFTSTATVVTCSSNTGASTSRFVGGFRFDNVTIPRGSSITAATVDTQSISTFADDANVDIHLEDVDDAVDYSTDPDTNNRVRTTASTTWAQNSLGTGVVTSPDFAPTLQEVTDRAGWNSEQALNVLFVGRADLNKTFSVAAEDHATSAPVVLDVTFIPPGGLFRRSFRGIARGVMGGV